MNTGLIEKIQNLPDARLIQVEDFVDFLTERKSSRTSSDHKNQQSGSVNLSDLGISSSEAAAQRAALSTFAEDWERPEMAIYDEL